MKEKAYDATLWFVGCLSWKQLFPQLFSYDTILKATFGLR